MLLLPATLTAVEARATQRLLTQALRSEPDSGVVVDASALQQFDSSALAVLLECQRQAQSWGRPFAVQQAPAKLVALAKLYGVDALLLPAAPAPAAAT
jgi:phospholipid transport system transporter-binding protein